MDESLSVCAQPLLACSRIQDDEWSNDIHWREAVFPEDGLELESKPTPDSHFPGSHERQQTMRKKRKMRGWGSN